MRFKEKDVYSENLQKNSFPFESGRKKRVFPLSQKSRNNEELDTEMHSEYHPRPKMKLSTMQIQVIQNLREFSTRIETTVAIINLFRIQLIVKVEVVTET